MPDTRQDDVTRLLRDASSGNREAVGELLPQVYAELRSLASSYLLRERADHTLQPTALVHEAYMRLVGQRTIGWEDRAQFFGAAATVMRRILVDHARARKAQKRGGGRAKTPLDNAVAAFEERAFDLVALDDALELLASIDQRKIRIVELRFFGGLTVDETAQVVGASVRSVERHWRFTRAWLVSRLS